MNDFLSLENRHTGEVLRLRRVRDPGGQVILLIDGSLPPGKDGPPLHAHLQQAEEGTVQAGSLGVNVAGKEIVVPTGGSASFPPGVVHKWWNAGDDLLRLSGRSIPALDLDRFLQALFAVLNASPSGRPSLFYLAHVLWRHRKTQVVMMPPPSLQRILFPAILLLGRLLGKYRGDRWPGSPVSCPGAPETSAIDS